LPAADWFDVNHAIVGATFLDKGSDERKRDKVPRERLLVEPLLHKQSAMSLTVKEKSEGGVCTISRGEKGKT